MLANNVTEMIKINAIKIANEYIGHREITPNRSPEIDKMQKTLKLGVGLPYCVIFCLYCYYKAWSLLFPSDKFPLLLTPSSQTLFDWAKKKNATYTDKKLIKPGDFVIWRKFNLWKGHCGLIISTVRPNETILTIEGNTSNNDFGRQSEGDGIYKRIRGVRKVDFDFDGFYLRGFLDISKILLEGVENQPL